MNNYLFIKIYNNNYIKLINKLYQIDINILNIIKYKKYIIIKINEKDYIRLKKYLYNYKYEINNYYGIKNILIKIKNNNIFLITIILSIIFLLFLNNIVYKIDIKTDNKEIKRIIKKELDYYGLKELSFKKRHNKIEDIVKKILDKEKDNIEWLEIRYDGLYMIVNVEERSKISLEDNNKYCNVVAKKNARIISLNIKRGMLLKDINDYVSKGDVIVSGDIIYNDEIKNRVCAKADIYGEVWYKVNIEMPLYEDEIKYTNKYRYNLSIGNKKIFRSRLKKYDTEKINIYKFNDFEINIIKEIEYKKKYIKLSNEDGYRKAINKVIDSINKRLNKDEEILYKKVLKKNINNSTIYLEIFIITKENIGSEVGISD